MSATTSHARPFLRVPRGLHVPQLRRRPADKIPAPPRGVRAFAPETPDSAATTWCSSLAPAPLGIWSPAPLQILRPAVRVADRRRHEADTAARNLAFRFLLPAGLPARPNYKCPP